MRLGEVCLIRTPETEQRFGGRAVFATVVRVVSDYIGFDIHGGMSVMARFDRTSRYAPACILCGTEETDDPMEDDRLYSFTVDESDRKTSPAHQALLDANGGPGFGKICEDCKDSLSNACEESGRPKPNIWLSPREHVRRPGR